MTDTTRIFTTRPDVPRLVRLEQEVRERYGDLLTIRDLAALLRYPSAEAVRKAHQRDQLPLALVRMAPRRGWFATARAVAELLERLESQPGHGSDCVSHCTLSTDRERREK